MEIAAVDPILFSMSDEPGIKAGMMAVIPSTGEENEDEVEIPDKTLVCAGQSLERSLYPHLSAIFTETGGFYHLQLPDLRGKFIIGVSQEGKFVMGDAIIYYEDIPDKRPPSRDIRDYA